MTRELPHVALSAHAHDRHGAHRTDPDWLDRRWADPATRVLVVAGTRIRPVDGRLAWCSPADAPDGIRVLLGEQDGTAYFATLVDPARAPGEQSEWVTLRAVVQHLLDDGGETAPMVLHAIGLAEWHWATRYCRRCGGRLASREAGHVLQCRECERQQFPRLEPAVIMLITDGEPGSPDERCLLGRSPQWPAGRFSTLAGFVEPGETMEDAVRREVHEETGVRVGEVRYFGSQPWPLPASLMIGFTGRADEATIEVDAAEIAEARWFTRDDLRRQASDGDALLPSGVSISRSLIESWYGGPLPGRW